MVFRFTLLQDDRIRFVFVIGLILLGLYLMSTPTLLKETRFISSEGDKISNAVSWVEERSMTDYDRIKLTAQYIKENTFYELRGESCLIETAEDVLEQGSGDCVSFSKVAAAMLTRMDIPVQIVEGCVFIEDTGDRGYQVPRDPSIKVNDTLSRASSHDTGQLHSWVRAYDGSKWYTIETTGGVIFPVSSENIYGYNRYGGTVNPADPWDLCLLIDERYVDFCRGDTND